MDLEEDLASLDITFEYLGIVGTLLLSKTVVVVIATAQLHSVKPKLRFCVGSNPARGVLEIRDGEDL